MWRSSTEFHPHTQHKRSRLPSYLLTIYTGLFKIIVGVLTTRHTQYTWDRSVCIFLFNRTTLQSFCYIPYRCSICAPFVILQTSTLQSSSFQTVCSMSAMMVSMAVLIRTFRSGIHTHPVSWNCAYHLRMELLDGGCFPNLVRNCRWTIAPRQSFWIALYI